MRVSVSLLVIFLIMICSYWPKTAEGEVNTPNTRAMVLLECEKNPDDLYNRREILVKVAEILNTSAPSFRMYEKEGFRVIDERPEKFFIYDLTDVSNKGNPLSSCVKLVDKHIYHAAAIYRPYSFSHILFLEGGEMKVFKSINCPGGDNLNDVINYLTIKLSGESAKDEILKRVRDYREHGVYDTIDDLSIRCKEMRRD